MEKHDLESNNICDMRTKEARALTITHDVNLFFTRIKLWNILKRKETVLGFKEDYYFSY